MVELGRQARSTLRAEAPPAAARGWSSRARRSRAAHADEIADELRVKAVEFGEVEASELRVKPNLPVLGPKLGTALPRGQRRSRRGPLHRARGRPLPGRRPRARAGRGARRADRPRGLGGRDRRRRHRRARDDARRRAPARGARERPDPRRAGAPQGLRPRDHRPDPALDPRRRTCSPFADRIADGDARGLGRARRRSCGSRRPDQFCASASASSRRSSTGSRNSMSSSRKRCSSMSVTPRSRNQSQTRWTSFSGAEAPGRDPDDADRLAEPRLVDLGLVVDQVGRHAAGARGLDEPVRVGRVPRADHEQQVDLRRAAPSPPTGGSRSRNRCPRAAARGSTGTARGAPRSPRASRRPRASSA